MYKWILAICLFIACNIMYAQDVEVQWKKTSEPIQAIDAEGNFVYASKILEDRYKEYKYPRDLSYIKTNSKSYARLFGINKKTKKLEVSYQEVTANGLKGESKLIVNRDYGAQVTVGVFGQSNLDVLSPDKKTLAYVDRGDGEWNVTVFDENLNILWTRAFSPGLKDVSKELTNIAVTNAGKVILAAQLYKKNFDPKIELQYQYKCWTISETEQSSVDIQFNSSVLPLDITISVIDDNTTILGGLYTSPMSPLNIYSVGATGSYIVNLNKGNIISKKYTPFDSGTLEIAGNKNNGLYSFVTIGITPLNNTYVLTTAHRGSYNSILYSNVSSLPDYQLYCNKIAVICYDNNSLTKKFEKVIENKFEPKYNKNNNVKPISIDNNLVLIYNHGLKTGAEYKVRISIIDESGSMKVNKEFIMPNDIRFAQVNPSDAIQFDSNKFLMNATEGNRNDGYGIITIKQ